MKIFKTFKIIISMLIIFIIISNVTVTFADSDIDDISPSQIFSGADSFLEAGTGTNAVLDDTSFKEVSNVIYNILLTVGIVAAVIVGLIIGIRMMIGSSTQKAETKELLIPYIVGCVVIFGAFGIWKLVVEILNQTQ